QFSGDYLGWEPRVSVQSPTYLGYSMVPTKGGRVDPGTANGLGTGTSPSSDTSALGNFGGKTLAFANATSGLGIVRLDALLTLGIPLNVQGGLYSGVLTLTAI